MMTTATANSNPVDHSAFHVVSIPRHKIFRRPAATLTEEERFRVPPSTLEAAGVTERGDSHSQHNRSSMSSQRGERGRPIPSEGVSTSTSSSNSKSHKRPRSEDPRGRLPHQQQSKHEGERRSRSSSLGREDERRSHTQKEVNHHHPERKQSPSSSSSSSHERSCERRNSASSGSSSGSSKRSGFRRLKKFTKSPTYKASSSPSSTRFKDEKETETSSTTTTTKNSAATPVATNSSPSVAASPTDTLPSIRVSSTSSNIKKKKKIDEGGKGDLSVSEKFQQAQLRLWKAAQERHQRMQQAQEQKRLKKKKEQEREGEGRAGKDDADTVGLQPSSTSSGSSKSSGSSAEKKEKKLRKLKKLKRWDESKGADETTTTTSTATAAAWKPEVLERVEHSTTLSDKSNTPKISKKKKRRLVKMGSTQGRGDDDSVARKKIKREKTSVQKKSFDSNPSQHLKSPQSLSTTATLSATPSTPPTMLSFGLADTVKTRVRSCTKSNKDKELELLQAASFEKKKRKKGSDNGEKVARDKSRMKLDEHGNLVKRKKKKTRRPVEYTIDDNGDEVPVKRKRGRPPKKRPTLEAITAYDADAEVPAEASVVQKTRGRPPKIKLFMNKQRPSLSFSDGATNGQSSEKRKTSEVTAPMGSSFSSHGWGFHQPENYPLPLKKRVAAASAADATWERKNACGGTTASKISISSGSGAAPELEASSISDFTHPTLDHSHGVTMLKSAPSSIPPEIFSKNASTPTVSSFDLSMGNPAHVIGPTVLSDSSDDSSDSDTDEEELYKWANKMFGTSAVPPKKEVKKEPTTEEKHLPPGMCEMERRRQQQEQARALTAKEIRAILKDDMNVNEPLPGNWVRRSVRQPSRSLLNTPLVRKLLDKLRGNDSDMVVLKMKKYLSDPDTPQMAIDAALDALEECTICEALYIQNFNQGMRDKQVLHLLRILQMPSCNIWCLNIGETYNVSDETWETFAQGLKKTKITHMYASEHTITSELKDEIRETIRQNRQKHNMHNDPNNLDVIIQCTHCWWNPINAKILRPYIRRRGLETLLYDKEAQGLRGSMSVAPGDTPTR